MKPIQWKRWVPAILFVPACAASLLLALGIGGVLSDDTRAPGQNTLGGFGALRGMDHNAMTILPLLYDDTNLYYERDGVLDSLDPAGGKYKPVCSRILCGHDVPDCPLYFLYDSEFLNYYVIDNDLYYTSVEDKTLSLWAWDIQKDTHRHVYDFPAVTVLTDEYGMEIETNNGISLLDRVNDTTIIAECGPDVYLFDNQFVVQDRFPSGAGNIYTWTEKNIFWTYGRSFYTYDLEEKRIYKNILEKFGDGSIASSSGCYACHNGSLYFTYDGSVMKYTRQEDTLTKLLDLQGSNTFALFGDNLYYMYDGAVRCMDLVTGEETQMAEMTDLPLSQTDRYLMQYTAEGHKLFDRNGRLVWE